MAIDSALMSPLVSLVSGVCSDTKSARFKISSMEAASMPSCAARAVVRKGSYPSTFISNDCARPITSAPIRPTPMTPSVLPHSCWPIKALRFHCPCIMLACAGIMRRTRFSIIASVSSATATVLPPGEFTTMTPRSVAAPTSMLSTPTPARPTICSLGAASITARVILVCERTISASKSATSSISSGSLRPVRV